MYREPVPVACADCGKPIPPGGGSAVDFGTGLSCAACTEAHAKLMRKLERKRERKRWRSPVDVTLAKLSLAFPLLVLASPFWGRAWLPDTDSHSFWPVFSSTVAALCAIGMATAIIGRKRNPEDEHFASFGIALNALGLALSLLTLAMCTFFGDFKAMAP